MRLPAALLTLFDCPIEAVLAALPDAADPVWERMPFRQRTRAAQDETRSIVFAWLDNRWGPDVPPPVARLDYTPAALSRAVEDCADRLRQVRPGTVTKLMLAELPPGASIPVHVDQAPALVRVHRCHVPVLTNREVRFWIDGAPRHLRAGTAYEIDNTRQHAVANKGSTRRVHLICDILPVGKPAA